MELFYPVIAIYILAFVAPIIKKQLPKQAWLILDAIPGVSFLYYFYLSLDFSYHAPISHSVEWIPMLGINLSLYLDGLSLLFLLLITAMGFLVVVYSGYYMKQYELKDRFYLYLLFFMASMMGLVLSGNLITMFVFWELTSVSSFLLIGFFHEKDESRNASLQALLITVMGGLALLSGIVLINQITGTFEIPELLSNPDVLRDSPYYLPVLILIFVGAFTKSAQFPFHFWLPNAMAGPSPVSAFLHSATMVKAGVYLLMRLNPVLGQTEIWQTVLSIVGVTTMFIGAYFALSQSDLKKILAYTTISALGILMMLIGINTTESIKAAVIFLVVHSLYKGALFMLAGSIDKKTGTRDIEQLGGLSKTMPFTTAAALISLFSMAGLPPFIGFVGKELIYEAKVLLPVASSYLLGMGVISNSIMAAISGILAWKVFFGQPGQTPIKPQETPFRLWLGPGVLALLSLVLGVFPDFFAKNVISPAASAVAATQIDVKLKLWHGFNEVLVLSIITVALGVVMFIYREKVIGLVKHIDKGVIRFTFAKAFSNLIDGFLVLTKKNTKFIQNGILRIYLMIIFVVASVFVWFQLIYTAFWEIPFQFDNAPYYEIGLVLLMIGATIFTVITTSRLTAIISMGVIGWGIALIFAFYGAIDLAITQIMVETLVVVLFVMVIYYLPLFKYYSNTAGRVRDGFIAVLFGGFMAILTYKANTLEMYPSISRYFNENSFTLGKGQNIVNVILVDFRALDTLGEIVVLTIAAIGVFSLMGMSIKKIRKKR
jgi:multicomponent Na+:H+ antiporter subunit A